MAEEIRWRAVTSTTNRSFPPETSGLVITHCPHGLDMRLHPRCYLCTPASGCECPLYWWGIGEPPCRVHNPAPPTVTTGSVTTWEGND